MKSRHDPYSRRTVVYSRIFYISTFHELVDMFRTYRNAANMSTFRIFVNLLRHNKRHIIPDFNNVQKTSTLQKSVLDLQCLKKSNWKVEFYIIRKVLPIAKLNKNANMLFNVMAEKQSVSIEFFPNLESLYLLYQFAGILNIAII